jgi:hypothetical protein
MEKHTFNQFSSGFITMRIAYCFTHHFDGFDYSGCIYVVVHNLFFREIYECYFATDIKRCLRNKMEKIQGNFEENKNQILMRNPNPW